MELNFIKMQGLGNDFVVVDAIDTAIALTAAQVQHISDRRRGVGCDQLLVVDRREDGAPLADNEFNYRIYNADGSESAQCGNGARCVARYLNEVRGAPNNLLLRTSGDQLAAMVHDDGSVTVDMGVPRFTPADVPFRAESEQDYYVIDAGSRSVKLSVVSMGNPHAVLRVESVDDAPVAEVGPLLESHPAFPERVNVGFLEIADRGRIRLRVFERGAGETEACGSGACAAVAVARRLDWVDQRCTVELTGGLLHIEWDGEGQVAMTGPAETVFEGKIKL